MYINGIEQVTTGSVITNIPNGSQPLEIGMQNFTPFLGAWVDELRIYKGNAPDQTTLRDWMCKKTTTSHPYYANMVANYDFDEDAGKTYASDKINCHNMYFIGSAGFVKSGAALGDISTHDYTTNTATANINFGTPTDNLSATMNAGTSSGIQLYGVNESPNSVQGIAAIPGNSLPSKYSSKAPPPVDT